MPPIDAAVKKNQQLQASGQYAPVIPVPVASQPSLPPPAPVLTGLPTRGTLPPGLILDTDFSASTKVAGIPQRSPMFPLQAPSSTTKTTVVESTTVSSGSSSSSLALSTNNVPNAEQNKLNFLAGANITIVSDGQGNEIISGVGGGTIPGFPYFMNNSPRANASLVDAFLSNFLNGANSIGGFLFNLPNPLTTGHLIILTGGSGDAVNTYDFGVFGPFDGTETVAPLLTNIGATTFASSSTQVKVAWTQGSVELAAGGYFFFMTTSGGSPTLRLTGWDDYYSYYSAYSITLSSGSVLPASVTVPVVSEVATINAGSAGPGIPQPCLFVLAP
jgi:hypothetical protein